MLQGLEDYRVVLLFLHLYRIQTVAEFGDDIVNVDVGQYGGKFWPRGGGGGEGKLLRNFVVLRFKIASV